MHITLYLAFTAKKKIESGNKGAVELAKELMRRNVSNSGMCLVCCKALVAMMSNCRT